MATRSCSVAGCEMPYRAKGYCGSHYNQFAYSGIRHAKKRVACAWCGRECEKHTTGTRRPVCSYACRTRLQHGDRRAVVGPLPWTERPRPTWDGQTLASPRRVFVQGACARCGEEFTASCAAGGPIARFCSDRCLKRRHAHPGRYQKWIEPARRYRIYERDGWICQLCGDPVDRSLPANDDWAPSLDHIIPRSATLVPDDSDRNLRLAHRWCNAIRGDEQHLPEGLFDR